jgi:hypothetical protein
MVFPLFPWRKCMKNIPQNKLEYIEKLLWQADNYTSKSCCDCRISHELIEKILSCFMEPDTFDITVPVETIVKQVVECAEMDAG